MLTLTTKCLRSLFDCNFTMMFKVNVYVPVKHYSQFNNVTK